MTNSVYSNSYEGCFGTKHYTPFVVWISWANSKTHESIANQEEPGSTNHSTEIALYIYKPPRFD